jgi:selenocysteine lyase/cysteine desulfurase
MDKSHMLRRDFFKRTGQSLAALWALQTTIGRRANAATTQPHAGGANITVHDDAFWAQVRDAFPLTRKSTYLNTGGLGASPKVSIDELKNKIDEFEEVSKTGHTHQLWSEVKNKAGLILGCDADEIAYTRNTTEGASIICNGLRLQRGDEVITSTHEHVGNIVSWLARQKRDGIVVKAFTPSTRSAQENVERIAALITPKTRALSISHVTCATGQILPVKTIGELAAAHGIWYFVDGAQAPGMLPVDVRDIGCHAYATSGHKWLLGPKGTGLLYVRRDALNTIDPTYGGGYSANGHWDMISSGQFEWTSTAQRFEYGTVSAPLFAGLGASMQFLLDIGIDNIWRRNHALGAMLIKGLNELGAEVVSPQDKNEHSSIITFRLHNMPYGELQRFLTQHYQMRTRGIYEGGLDALRVSLHLYNSPAEVERVLEGVAAAKKL